MKSLQKHRWRLGRVPGAASNLPAKEATTLLFTSCGGIQGREGCGGDAYDLNNSDVYSWVQFDLNNSDVKAGAMFSMRVHCFGGARLSLFLLTRTWCSTKEQLGREQIKKLTKKCVHTYLGVCIGVAKTIYIYGVCTVILAGKSPNIRSYTVFIYGSGQPCVCGTLSRDIST